MSAPVPAVQSQAAPADPCFLRLGGCDMSSAIACWLAEERRLRSDLKLAAGSVDAEVLEADLRAAERQIDALLTTAREARR